MTDLAPVEQDPARELVARALADEFGHGYIDGGLSVVFLAEDGYSSIRSAKPFEVTDVVLAALAEAGRLLPAGGTTREVVGTEEDGFIYEGHVSTSEGRLPVTHRRTVTEWPNGSTYTTGWVEVGTDE